MTRRDAGLLISGAFCGGQGRAGIARFWCNPLSSCLIPTPQEFKSLVLSALGSACSPLHLLVVKFGIET